MNKGAGTLLATIVAISLFANSNAPRQAPPRRAGAGADKQRAAPVVAEKSEAPRWTPPPPDPRCFLLKTISGFYGHGNSIPTGAYSNAEELKGCAPGERWGLSCDEASHIHFVIATVPDPVRTHLSLFFDRSIDAIQEAAQEEGWVFGAGGMPWDSGEHAESTDLDMRIAQQSYQKQRESLPGLMMFRRFRRPDLDLKHCKDSQQSQNPCGNIGDYDSSFNDNDVLFVFVVGETPTGGVRKGQFIHALEMMREIQKAPSASAQRKLYVLGPTFSGSFFSLWELLQHPEVKTLAWPVVVHSGTVVSYVTGKWFLDRLPEHVSFTPFQESDLYGGCRFLRYARTLQYKLSQIAILSEDETAYGKFMINSASQTCGIDSNSNNGKNDNDDVVRLYFPREISQLRNAYQRDLQVEQPGKDVGNKPQRLTLRLNLEDTSKEEDTVAPYSRQQTPLSQESIVLGITTALRAHHINFIIIRATDPLDMVFLTRYLRQTYPQGRLVTLGADLLFRREVEDDLLHGIMAITSYSLLPRQDEQTATAADSPPRPHVDRVFPSSSSAGTYNAMLGLLTKMRTSTENRHPSAENADLDPAGYTEYGWPAIGDGRPQTSGEKNQPHSGYSSQLLKPAMWLTVLGRDAYWPMALLDNYKAHCCEIPSRLHSIRSDEAKLQKFEPFPPDSWAFLAGVGCATVLIFIFYIRWGSLFATSEALVTFAPVRDWRRTYILLLASLFLAVLLLLLGWPALHWYSISHWKLWFWGLLLFLVLLVASSISDLIRRQSKTWSIAYVLSLGVIIAVAVELYRIGSDFHVNEAIFRYVHLTSGVSPLPACLSLLVAGLWWTWYSLQGTIFLDRCRPRLPSQRELGVRFFPLTEEGNRSLTAALQPVTRDLRVYLPAITVLLFTLATVNSNHPVQTLEGRAFDRLYAATLLGVALTLLTTLSQLFIGWLECRRMLAALDRLPLRRALKRLSGFSWKPIWSLGGGPFQESNRLISREMEAFTHVTHINPAIEGVDQHMFDDLRRKITAALEEIYAEKSRWRERFAQDRMRRLAEFNEDFVGLVEDFQKKLALVCGAVFKSLQLAWSLEPGFGLFESQDCEIKKDSPDKSQIPEATQIRERFVCLVYVNFIMAALSRMRSLIVITAGMYVFLLLSITVYPVEPKLTLRPLLILLFFFIMVMVGIIYAQMHRDATLSLLTDTKPGELGRDFWLRITAFAAVPLLSLVLAQFPDVSAFLFSWLQPAMQALNH